MARPLYTLPPSLHEVNEEMTLLDNKIHDLTTEFIAADEAFSQASYEAKKAEVLAFGASQGAMDLRKNVAKEAALKLEWQVVVTGTKYRAIRARMEEIRQRMDTLRSIGSNIKSEMGVTGSGYGSGS